MGSIALLAPIHDPKGRLLERIGSKLKEIHALFDRVYLTISEGTAETIKQEIDSFQFANNHTVIIPKNGAADARRRVLKEALNDMKKVDHYLYCDFDRLLTWLEHYPEELAEIVKTKRADYLVIGRTEQAFNSHPYEWQVTERLTNEVAAVYFERNVLDITAGSCLFSREAGEYIAEHSTAKMTDSEWPKLVSELKDTELNYLPVDGLLYNEELNSQNIRADRGKNLSDRIRLCHVICESLYGSWK